jgi:ParB family chromosome partitioning protein
MKLKGKQSLEILGETTGDSKDTVHRHIRLTNLIPQLLDMVDNSAQKEKGIPQIAMRPAVELSYLPPEQQQLVLVTIESEDCTPSHEQALKMRKFAEEGRLNEDVILSIMQEEKANQVEHFKMPRDKISKFFPQGTTAQKIEETIIKALELWRQKERNRDAR